MKTIPTSGRAYYLARLCIFLIAVALIVVMVGCDGYTPSQNLEIRTWYDLDAVRNNLEGNHILMNDLDSTSAGYGELASPTANGGRGWQPIGWGYWVSGPPWIRLVGEPFTGSFDGQGHEIRHLFISYSGEPQAGLLGCVGKGGIIRNLGVVNATLTFSSDVEGLVRLNQDTLETLDVAPIFGVGILVGFSMGSVTNSYSSGTVSARVNVSAGGLVGQNTGTVKNCYSTANVTGTWGVGGLVGSNGDLLFSGTVRNSYSTGSITGDEYVGGLVGELKNQATVGGFWDIETSRQSTSAGGTGKTTAELKNVATFSGAGWSITAVANAGTRNPSYIWNIVNGQTYPFLSWQA